MADPTRDYPDSEIEGALESFGSWFGWLCSPERAIEALKWKANRGDELPEQLVPLRDVLMQFGQAPIEELTDRLESFEKAFSAITEITEIVRAAGDFTYLES